MAIHFEKVQSPSLRHSAHLTLATPLMHTAKALLDRIYDRIDLITQMAAVVWT